jgi:cytochrome P450
MGIHHCVGQHLARQEAESLVTALEGRVNRIELAGPPRRHHDNTLRGWPSLPVRIRLA